MEQDKPQEQARPRLIEVEAQVAETKGRVAAQMALIAELRRLGYDTTEATAALSSLTDQLLRCYEELAHHQAGGWRHTHRQPDDRGGAGPGADAPVDPDNA